MPREIHGYEQVEGVEEEINLMRNSQVTDEAGMVAI